MAGPFIKSYDKIEPFHVSLWSIVGIAVLVDLAEERGAEHVEVGGVSEAAQTAVCGLFLT